MNKLEKFAVLSIILIMVSYVFVPTSLAIVVPFSDGFESGGFGLWTSSSGTASVTNVDSVSGSYCAELGQIDAESNAHFIAEVPEASSFTAEFEFKVVEVGDAEYSTFPLFSMKHDSYTVAILAVYHSVSTYSWRLYYLSGSSLTYTITGNVPIGQWMTIRLDETVGASGSYILTVNGSPIVELTDLDNSARGNINTFDFGFNYLNGVIYRYDSVSITSGSSASPSSYSLTLSSSSGGSTTPLAGTYTYDADSSVQVSASANAGYVFSYWILDSVNVGSVNPYSVTMGSDHSLTAVFESSTGGTGTVPSGEDETGALVCVVLPESSELFVGESETFSCSVTGGSGVYSYQWYINDEISSQTGASITVSSSVSGTFNVYCVVSDSLGASAQSNVATLTVNNADGSSSTGGLDVRLLAISGLGFVYAFGFFSKKKGGKNS